MQTHSLSIKPQRRSPGVTSFRHVKQFQGKVLAWEQNYDYTSTLDKRIIILLLVNKLSFQPNLIPLNSRNLSLKLDQLSPWPFWKSLILCIISSGKRIYSFIWTNLNSFYVRMLCARFGWDWPSGSDVYYDDQLTATTSISWSSLSMNDNLSRFRRWNNSIIE